MERGKVRFLFFFFALPSRALVCVVRVTRCHSGERTGAGRPRSLNHLAHSRAWRERKGARVMGDRGRGARGALLSLPLSFPWHCHACVLLEQAACLQTQRKYAAHPPLNLLSYTPGRKLNALFSLSLRGARPPCRAPPRRAHRAQSAGRGRTGGRHRRGRSGRRSRTCVKADDEKMERKNETRASGGG